MPNWTGWKATVQAARVPRLTMRLPHTVTIAPWRSRDAYGKPSYGPNATYPARVETDIKTVRTPDGQERTSNTTILIAGGPSVSLKDRLTLPDGSTPPIVSLATQPGPDGAALYTLLFT